MFKRIKEFKKLKKTLNNLSNTELVLLNNGHFVKKNNKLEIVYDKVITLLSRCKLNQLSDEILINILKEIDDALIQSTNLNKELLNKVKYLRKIAGEINQIILSRFNTTIQSSIKLIDESNNLIKQGLLEEIQYNEIYINKIRLEYYLNNVIYNEKIKKLIFELGFIFYKKIQFKIVETKRGKIYEKTCISI